MMKENVGLKEDVRRLQGDLSSAIDKSDALLQEAQNLRHVGVMRFAFSSALAVVPWVHDYDAVAVC